MRASCPTSTASFWYWAVREAAQTKNVPNFLKRSKRGVSSAPKFKKSKIQNVDYFEMRGSRFLDFPKFKRLKYGLDFDDIWVRSC